jgi:hypothetical protein
MLLKNTQVRKITPKIKIGFYPDCYEFQASLESKWVDLKSAKTLMLVLKLKMNLYIQLA